ncbi:hypothetical protein KAJ83_04520 [Marivibrio halodurans]|uniref:Uncharacterized protein n=1 Tax=Marivibrio halodurans TaxID=2039722 RepID=A0A8J7V1E2_9PROT|nr:hypothetical protein [Marivibrio halodurans]MBP5856260.1 hypothetical protein [Marivibrio halodurans]
MVVLTFLGRLLVIFALAMLGLGLWLWLSGADVTQQAGQLWYVLDRVSLNGAQVLVQRHLHLPWLWDSGILPLLRRPAWEAVLWLVIGGLATGGLLLVISRRRARRSSFR